MRNYKDVLAESDSERSAIMQEMAVLPGLGEAVSVRAAKAHLSGLLDLVAAGREVIITSSGKPKARVVPFDAMAARRPFSGTAEHLASMPAWREGSSSADEIIRADRDGRGW